jgi:hypothetical protein
MKPLTSVDEMDAELYHSSAETSTQTRLEVPSQFGTFIRLEANILIRFTSFYSMTISPLQNSNRIIEATVIS